MDLLEEALARFDELYQRALQSGLWEPSAVNFATVGEDGRPSSRILLLKGVDERGFVFYTNLDSRKARELDASPYAALCFFWPPLMEQVRVEGAVSRVTEAEADDYWRNRDPESQLGAWASHQSSELAERSILLDRIESYRRKFHGREVPRPSFWSGYRVSPDTIEFWRALAHRLNERVCYRKRDGEWSKSMLQP